MGYLSLGCKIEPRACSAALYLSETWHLALVRRFKGKSERSKPRIPAGKRVYVVGDIHGRADLLEILHRLIVADAARKPIAENLVVYLGDYIDRGAQVRRVLEMLLAGLPGFHTIHLRGNHEELMLLFLEDAALLEPWLELGGQATLLNYRVAIPGDSFRPEKAAKLQKALLQAIPGTHLYFLRRLKVSFTLGDYFFVHAGIRPGVPICRQSSEDLLWIRDGFLVSAADHGAMIVHGHTIVAQPEILPNRIGLDTGAYATGVLTCAVLESDQIRFLSREGN